MTPRVALRAEESWESADEVVAAARGHWLRTSGNGGFPYVAALSRVRGATREHSVELAKICLECGDGTALGEMTATYLEGASWALNLDELTELCESAEEQWFGHSFTEMAIWWGLHWAGRIDETAWREMVERGPGPFGEALIRKWGVHDGVGSLTLSPEHERLVMREGWWGMLSACTVGDEAFAFLLDRAAAGEIAYRDLWHVTTSRGRLTALAAAGGGLDEAVVRNQREWLAREPELLRWALSTSGTVPDGLFTYATLPGEWGWEWVSDEWLENLSAKEAVAVAHDAAFASDVNGDGDGRCDHTTMARVLTHVRGAAAQALTRDGFSRDVLTEVLAELFGENREVARGLINPATNLTELADVVARLG